MMKHVYYTARMLALALVLGNGSGAWAAPAEPTREEKFEAAWKEALADADALDKAEPAKTEEVLKSLKPEERAAVYDIIKPKPPALHTCAEKLLRYKLVAYVAHLSRDVARKDPLFRTSCAVLWNEKDGAVAIVKAMHTWGTYRPEIREALYKWVVKGTAPGDLAKEVRAAVEAMGGADWLKQQQK